MLDGAAQEALHRANRLEEPQHRCIVERHAHRTLLSLSWLFVRPRPASFRKWRSTRLEEPMKGLGRAAIIVNVPMAPTGYRLTAPRCSRFWNSSIHPGY